MAATYNLLPNESMILKETNVAHGGIMAVYSDELILTSLNIVCISKGIFGNVKGIYQYPLNQIKLYNEKPQVFMGKISNGLPSLEVYFTNGRTESFRFQSGSRRKINEWIEEINKVLGPPSEEGHYLRSNGDYDPNSLVGAFKIVGEQVMDAGAGILGNLGFKSGRRASNAGNSSPGSEKISKKCVSCSAPLIGYKGGIVKCKYCDTEQTL